MASTAINEIIKGRKVFFIAPDKSLIPPIFLEEYLTIGYECYFIENDKNLSISMKIDIILSIFKDSILFFNIDFPITAFKWADFIQELKTKYPESLFGVIYNKRQLLEERTAIEKQYLFDIGLQCGCIQLSQQRKENFEIIERMLYANQAMGRRKNVRVLCTPTCTYTYEIKEDVVISGTLTDISTSHFSFVTNDENFKASEQEHLHDIQLKIKDFSLKTDAILYMTRTMTNGKLYVFAFAAKNGQLGLDNVRKQALIPKIYSVMSDTCNEFLNRLFKSATTMRDDKLGDLGIFADAQF